ncbi:hypothetical protein ABT010_40810 [Streptomyces sp. NPDC002668]|uniref:hypothetical protein n=1 Tax=Streptomyces sp. NPDC002668 TaxID=3154422 RepID=UPI0033278649
MAWWVLAAVITMDSPIDLGFVAVVQKAFFAVLAAAVIWETLRWIVHRCKRS